MSKVYRIHVHVVDVRTTMIIDMLKMVYSISSPSSRLGSYGVARAALLRSHGKRRVTPRTHDVEHQSVIRFMSSEPSHLPGICLQSQLYRSSPRASLDADSSHNVWSSAFKRPCTLARECGGRGSEERTAAGFVFGILSNTWVYHATRWPD